MATLSSAKLELWIYTGTINSYDPANPNYTISKTKLPGEDNIYFEIAELVKDYVTINFTGDYGSATITAWASWSLTNTYDDGTTATKSNTILASHGYGYFEDEINPQLIQALQQTNTCIYWKKGEKVRIPLYRYNEFYNIEFYEGDVLTDQITYNEIYTKLTADTTEITADSTLFTADATHVKSIESDNISGDVVVPLDTTKVKIITIDGEEIELNIYYIEECKNTPYKVTFLNKFGALQDIWMFGRRRERANVSRESFKTSTIQSSASGVIYPLHKSTDKTHNVETNKSLTLNTSFVCEQYNEVVQELLLSEYVWIHEDQQVFPIIPKDNVVEYKTHLYEKLLNYTINFDYAYSEINLVR